ncbi:hypothetical protein AC578_8771 [Pseudocercospora eumusae]|uniref:BHLH domain-containing protein n=1 Tax=Pseudocercospora eumusae TaxID=321146 RepID=A0A139H6E8_9PEZI|nr:hypothetical protein AC578_8771 [Pseudocercospora eumusae]
MTHLVIKCVRRIGSSLIIIMKTPPLLLLLLLLLVCSAELSTVDHLCLQQPSLSAGDHGYSRPGQARTEQPVKKTDTSIHPTHLQTTTRESARRTCTNPPIESPVLTTLHPTRKLPSSCCASESHRRPRSSSGDIRREDYTSRHDTLVLLSRTERRRTSYSAPDNLTVFPPFEDQSKESPHHKRDSPLEFTFDDLGGGGSGDDMAGATSPYIKSEPNDFNFNDPNMFQQYNNQQGHMGQSYGGGVNMNVNPANLTNGNGPMSNSFIGDDELLDLQIDSAQPTNGDFSFNTGVQNFMQQQQNTFSHTPDGAPMHSPFSNDGFNYSQFRPAPGQQQFGAHSVPTQAAFRPHMQHIDRKVSDSRSPATPNTPGIQHLQVNDEFTHPGMQPIQHRQQGSIGNGWDSTPSGHSWDASSPFPSPHNGQPHHPQIAEVLKNSGHHHGKVASSLPTKMEPGAGPPFNTQEAKRRRRRESHNMVERRRRDNINERIHDLGTLVPQHRLEDEKVRKHLQTNAPLSPSIANAGMSPPNAASLLGTSARRTAGSITQGLPMEEKDKGPNKGDILNGSVAWTRDMMWFMHMKLNQEQQLKQLVSDLGAEWPFDQSEEEKRMTSEILEVLNKHAAAGGFTGYSRHAGSGLRVPGYTNLAGDSTNGDSPQNLTIPPLSPGFQPGGSGMSSGVSHSNYNWATDFKEEDEYGMDTQ